MAVMWSLIIGLFLLVLPLAPSSSSSMTFKLLGSVYPEGHFYVELPIGQPPRHYYLDIDTGSNLTWLECKYNNRCDGCNQVPHQLYVPTQTNLGVPCNSRQCTALREDVDSRQPPCSTDPHHCHYRVGYADGSTSEGVLATDVFYFPAIRQRKGFFFGCGYKQHPLKRSPVDGLLGLGSGQVSFVKQLRLYGLITKNVIGHCMSVKGKGYLKIGDFALPSGGVTWMDVTKHGYHYSPGKATLLFDGQQTSAREMKVIFDSGATYTYMPDPAYLELVTKVKATLSKSLTEVHDVAMDLCWKGKKPFKTVDDVKGEFRPLALKFDEGHRLDIPPENYLIVTQRGNVCFGIINGSKQRSTANVYLIGDVTMQDLLVIYDNEAEKIGWVRANCIASVSEPAIDSRL